MKGHKKYCPGCDDVWPWPKEEKTCDVCGEDLLGSDDGVEGIALLLEYATKIDALEARITKLKAKGKK